MTGGARQSLEVKRYYLRTLDRLVTFIAGHRHMAAREWKSGGLVQIEGVVGGFECGSLMAALAAVEPGSGGKLALVHILMAVCAPREVELEASVFAGRGVASGAGDVLMGEGEREAGFCMLRCGEGGRAPTLHGVTAFAFAGIRAVGELSVMWIWLVAICALGVRKRGLEVTGAMAVNAGDVEVLAEKRETCF